MCQTQIRSAGLYAYGLKYEFLRILKHPQVCLNLTLHTPLAYTFFFRFVSWPLFGYFNCPVNPVFRSTAPQTPTSVLISTLGWLRVRDVPLLRDGSIQTGHRS